MSDNIVNEDALNGGFESIENEEMSDEQFNQMNADYEQSIVDGSINQPVQETQVETQVEVEVEVEVTQPVVTPVENSDELTIEQLESLLPQEVKEEVIETSGQEGDGGNLNIALSQARQKTAESKQREAESKQREVNKDTEIELLKQRLALHNQQVNTTQVQPQVDTTKEIDIYEGLQPGMTIDDTELKGVIDKLEQKHQLELQKQQQVQSDQALQQQYAKEQQSIEAFTKTHGPDKGVLSFDSVDNLVKTGKVILTEGQQKCVTSAINDNKDPAELYYNFIVNEVPALKTKMEDEIIKRRLVANSKNNTVSNTVVESASSIDNDFINIEAQSNKNLSNHLDSLCDW